MTKHFNDEYDAVVELDINAAAISILLEDKKKLKRKLKKAKKRITELEKQITRRK